MFTFAVAVGGNALNVGMETKGKNSIEGAANNNHPGLWNIMETQNHEITQVNFVEA